MKDTKTETIRGVCFALYNGPSEIEVTPKFSTSFFVTVVIILVYSVLLLHFGTQEILKGNPRAVQIFSGAFLLGPYVAMFGLIFWRKISRQPKIDLPPVPDGVPKDALYSTCRIAWSTQTSLATHGWAWLEGGQLAFEGDRFGWRLNAEDVNSLSSRTFEQKRLKLPKGFPYGLLTVKAADKKQFSELLSRWKQTLPTGKASVFPPIDLPMKKVNAGSVAIKLFPFAALFGLVIGAVFATLRIDSYQERLEMPYVAGFAVFALTMMFPMLLLADKSSSKTHAKLLEKLRR